MSEENIDEVLQSIENDIKLILDHPEGQEILTNLGFVMPIPKTPNSGFPSVNPNEVNFDSNLGSSGSDYLTGLSEAYKVVKITSKAASQLASGNIAGFAGTVGGAEAAELYDQLKSAVSGVANKYSNIKPSFTGGKTDDIEITPPPPSGGDFGDRGTAQQNSYTKLTMSPHPVEIRYVSGIKADAYTPENAITETGYAFPYHCTGAIFQFPPNYINSDTGTLSLPTTGITVNNPTSTTLSSFISSSVMRDLLQLITRNVSFSVKDIVSPTSLLQYFNALAYGLQIYFSVVRYAVAASNPNIRNEAMKALGNSFTSTHEFNFIQLQRLLSGLPIPPRLMEYMFWLMQLYRTSTCPKSAVISINPFPISQSTGLPDWSCIASAVNILNNFDNVSSVIGKAIPSWYNTTLPTASASPVHDPNFNTVFVNLPVMHKGSSPSAHDIFHPAVTNATDMVYFNTYSDELDGSMYALTSLIYPAGASVSNAKAWPSFIIPYYSAIYNSTTYTNRYYWNYDRFADNFYSEASFLSRDETYTVGFTLTLYQNNSMVSGTQRVKGVNVESITETAQKVFDHILDLRSIPVVVNNKLTGSHNIITSDRHQNDSRVRDKARDKRGKQRRRYVR